MSAVRGPAWRALPARPAVTAAVTARATTAATGPAIKATTAAGAAKTTATAAFRLRASFIDVHGASAQLGSVQLRDGGVGGLPVAHFHERETARLSALAIGDDVNAVDCAELAERGFQIGLCGVETQISDENIGHAVFPPQGLKGIRPDCDQAAR